MPVRRVALLLIACALAAPAAVHAAAPKPPTGGTAMPATDPRFGFTPNVLVGGVVTFSGSLPADAGRTVSVERLDPASGAWVAIATAPIGAGGAYTARWTADVKGRFATRVTVGGSLLAGAPPQADLTVYRPALATWFGPGFYGKRTKCGQRLTKGLLGVGHRTLPCGTMIAFTYKGRSITVPVVDTGPFNGKMRWDLTKGAATLLGFTHTDRLGAVRVAAEPHASR